MLWTGVAPAGVRCYEKSRMRKNERKKSQATPPLPLSQIPLPPPSDPHTSLLPSTASHSDDPIVTSARAAHASSCHVCTRRASAAMSDALTAAEVEYDGRDGRRARQAATAREAADAAATADARRAWKADRSELSAGGGGAEAAAEHGGHGGWRRLGLDKAGPVAGCVRRSMELGGGVGRRPKSRREWVGGEGGRSSVALISAPWLRPAARDSSPLDY